MSDASNIAITCGDPAGVGPEIIERWLRDHPEQSRGVSIIGPQRWLEVLPIDSRSKHPVGDKAFSLNPGSPCTDGAKVALEALEYAAQGCRDGLFSSVVTAPISKLWMARVGFIYAGHTEFFANRWGGDPSMAFAGGKLTVVLATWHIPLMDVADYLTPDAIHLAVKSAYALAQARGVADPRVAVCGLNPHAGESGLLGREEKDIIDPILDELRQTYSHISSTQPADTVFSRHLQGHFDAVVALYHDQGLAPLKTLEFEQSVNITLGLPWVRTSPDHGTAFDIAGQGKASLQSFINAIAWARRLEAVRAIDSQEGGSE